MLTLGHSGQGRALGERGLAEPSREVSPLDAEVRAQLAWRGHLEYASLSPSVSSGLSSWASCWRDQPPRTSLSNCWRLCFLPSLWSWNSQFNLGFTGSNCKPAPDSHPRRKCWSPWPVLPSPSFPGAKPRGRWWEVPYLGCPECWNEVGISRARQEGPYLVRSLQPGTQGERGAGRRPNPLKARRWQVCRELG